MKKNQKIKAKRCFNPLCWKAGNNTKAGKPLLFIYSAFLHSPQRPARRFAWPTHLSVSDSLLSLSGESFF
jgi:hypothetical protein